LQLFGCIRRRAVDINSCPKLGSKRGIFGPAPDGREMLASEAMRPSTATAQWHRRLAEPDILVEVELVVDLAGAPQGKPLLEKYNVEDHGGEFYQGVIVNGGRLLYLAGQVANEPDGSVSKPGDWQRQAEKVYENIGHVLRAAGATSATVVKETTWVVSIDGWRQHRGPVRRAFYKGDFPASTLVEIPGLAHTDYLVEIEVIAAVA